MRRSWQGRRSPSIGISSSSTSPAFRPPCLPCRQLLWLLRISWNSKRIWGLSAVSSLRGSSPTPATPRVSVAALRHQRVSELCWWWEWCHSRWLHLSSSHSHSLRARESRHCPFEIPVRSPSCLVVPWPSPSSIEFLSSWLCFSRKTSWTNRRGLSFLRGCSPTLPNPFPWCSLEARAPPLSSVLLGSSFPRDGDSPYCLYLHVLLHPSDSSPLPPQGAAPPPYAVTLRWLLQASPSL